MARSGVHATCLVLLISSLVLLQVAEASSGRMLLSSGDRPAHDYASSISMVSSQAAIQRLATTGGAANVKKATELSIKNAQHSTKSWHMGYDDGLKGASGNKMARDQDDDRK